MAGHTYVNKGYYTDVPAYGRGYVYEPEHVNWYMVETTTVERVRVPAAGYAQFGGVPSDHHEVYQLTYGPEYENSSPPRYHEKHNLMANFLNKIQIGASRPTKTSNLSIPDNYSPTSPNKYRSTSPKNYPSTSPKNYHPTNLDKHHLTSPNKYSHTSPNKYRYTSPDKYRPTSPIHNYPPKEAHLTTDQTLPVRNKYQSTSPIKYQPTSPRNNYRSKEYDLIKAQNLPSPNKYQPTSPDRRFPLKEGQSIKTQSLLRPNKEYPSSPRSEGGRQNFAGPNSHWQNESPRAARHTLSNPTNNIDEALSLLAVSANYSPRSDQKRDEAFDNASPRARPFEYEGRYARPAFGGGTTRYARSNTIDSHEAISRYDGAYVP